MATDNQAVSYALSSAICQPDLQTAAAYVSSSGNSAYYLKTIHIDEKHSRDFSDIPPFTDAFECFHPIYVNNNHSPGCRTFLKFHALYCPVKIRIPEGLSSFQLKCYLLPSNTKTMLRRTGITYNGLYYLEGMARPL